MLSFRGFTSLIWSLTAFMLAAALALHLRYRPLADEPAYLDTWTGTVSGAAASVPPGRAITLGGTSDVAPALERKAIVRLRSRLRADRVAVRSAPCVEFAFPAPGSSSEKGR